MESFRFSLSQGDSTIAPFHYSSGSFADSKSINDGDNRKSSSCSSKKSGSSIVSEALIKPTGETPENCSFTHAFVCVHRYERLFKCQMQTLFARIRINPHIPIIQTPNSLCATNSLDVDCSYALDFRNVPPFELNDFTPVIELYRRIPKRSELIGISLLPLKIIEKILLGKKLLTYFYHNSRVPLTSIETGGLVGTLVVSFGFGFQEHQPLFDPKILNPKGQTPIKQIKQNEEEEEEEEEVHHRHHHRHKKGKNNWQKMALAVGWKPPSFVDSDWKMKALKKGWIPPDSRLLSSIGINCKKGDIVPKESISTQYDPVLLTNNIKEEVSSSLSHSDSYENDLEDLIMLLNTKSKKKNQQSSHMSLQSPSTIYQQCFPKLTCTPVFQLLDLDQIELLSEDQESSDEVIQNVDELINNTLHNVSNQHEATYGYTNMLRNGNKQQYVSSKPSIKLSSSDEENLSSNTETSSTSSNSDNIWRNIGKKDPEMKRLIDIVNNKF